MFPVQRSIVVLLVLLGATWHSPAQEPPSGLRDFAAEAKRKIDHDCGYLEALYKHLHTHPELCYWPSIKSRIP